MYEVNIALCAASIVFHIFLCIVYFRKKGMDNTENKVYKYMIITNTVILLSAIISDISYPFMGNQVPVFMTLVFKLFYISTVVWFLLMNYYSFLLKSTYNVKILHFLNKNSSIVYFGILLISLGLLCSPL